MFNGSTGRGRVAPAMKIKTAGGLVLPANDVRGTFWNYCDMMADRMMSRSVRELRPALCYELV